MKKEVLVAASFYYEKCYFNEKFKGLASEIKNKLKGICILSAMEIHGDFIIGVCEDGSIYFQAKGDEGDLNFDEAAASSKVEKLKTEEKELIRELGLWYVLYFTEDGQKILNSLKG